VTDNQYDSLSSLVTKRSGELQRRAPTRPVGVSILAVLNLLGGIAVFGAQFLLLVNLPSMEEPLRTLGIPPVLLIIGMIFLAVLTFASGVGMWLGTKWGWWLATFYYVYSVFRNASALLTIMAAADQLEGTRGPEFYLFKHSVRIVISFLLLLYFFKSNVLEFFGMKDVSKAAAGGILLGVGTAITLAMSVIGLMAG
jgi:hypothetical protein